MDDNASSTFTNQSNSGGPAMEYSNNNNNTSQTGQVGGGAEHPQFSSIYSDTVTVLVDGEWCGGGAGQVQLCPSIFTPQIQCVPQVVKHIYGRLASAAAEIDQGVPELLLALVGSGASSLGFENSERLVRGLSRIISRCGFWAVTSGEHSDPLAVSMASALRSTLPHQESNEETLLIVANSADIIYNPSSMLNQPPKSMIDSSYNTFYIVWNYLHPSEQELHEFRSCLAINLANPPPALFIGVPAATSGALGRSAYDDQQQQHYYSSFTAPQTPLGSPTAPAILFPSFGNTDLDRIPLPIALFCSASLSALSEMENYVQCGVPVLVIQDSSELCAFLKSAFMLYQSAGFEHHSFMEWTEAELRRVLIASGGGVHHSRIAIDVQIDDAKRIVGRIVATALDDERPLVAFVPSASLENVDGHLLDLLVRSCSDNATLARVLNLAVKLNVAVVVRTIRLESVVSNQQQIENLLVEALSTDDRMDVLSALLDQNVSVRITSNLLLEWLERTPDQYFFNTVILGHFLGYTYKLNKITEFTALSINRLLKQLSGGVNCLFPVECFSTANEPSSLMSSGSVSSTSVTARSVQVLAVWALLLNRCELVKMLCAYSQEPIALSLVLAKVSRNLSRKSREWFFYEQKLLLLSNYLTSAAVRLLDTSYSECALKAYRALCHRPTLSNLSSCCSKAGGGIGTSASGFCECVLNRLTLAELAFEMNAREFIAHDCCQRFVLRLLHGNLQVRNSLTTWSPLPNWLKIMLSAVFVAPIACWITSRPCTVPSSSIVDSVAARVRSQFAVGNDDRPPLVRPSTLSRPLSPTVALLEDGRQVKSIRSNSVYSCSYSMKSSVYREGSLIGGNYNRDAAAATVTNTTNNGGVVYNAGSAEPQTPNSVVGVGNSGTNETDAFLAFGQQNYFFPQTPTHPPQLQHYLPRTPSSGGTTTMGGSNEKRKRSSSATRRKKSSKTSGSLAMVDRFRANRATGSGKTTADRAPQRIAHRAGGLFTSELVMMFYSTPITKYWLSLLFRIAYLVLLAYSVALPSCGSLLVESAVWIWSFMWLLESLWVFSIRLQSSCWREMPWTMFDIICVSLFLAYLLLARVGVNNVNLFGNDWYNFKAVWAFFLLYECYKTLFVYVPLSEVLGPFLVRIKLMVLHDFINFIVLMLLVILSAITIKAMLYPDLSLSHRTIAESVGWSFMGLFTTDLSVLEQSDECRRSRLPVNAAPAATSAWCEALTPGGGVRRPIGGYANPHCPVQSWPAAFAVLEYLLVLKVISWPILFALFARTAKRVDEEAEQIWRYQLYSLATNFSIRPFLPPPLTPLVFIALSCCRMTGCISGLFRRFTFSAVGDHPDVRKGGDGTSPSFSTHSKFSTVYRNPSSTQGIYWRRLAVQQWKTWRKTGSAVAPSPLASTSTATQYVNEKLDLLFLFNNIQRSSGGASNAHGTNVANLPANLPQNAHNHFQQQHQHKSFNHHPPSGATLPSQQSRASAASPSNSPNPSFTSNASTALRDNRSRAIPSPLTLSASTSSAVHGHHAETEADWPATNFAGRIAVAESCRAWSVLMPNYCPLKYSKPVEEFPLEVQKYVHDHCQQNASDVRRHWRQRRLYELLGSSVHPSPFPIGDGARDTITLLSGDGIPLNPSGRTGMAGRGEHPRFGPNKLYFYVIFTRERSTTAGAGSLCVLACKPAESGNHLSDDDSVSKVGLPSRWRYLMRRSDEYFGQLLTAIGASDSDVQLMTSRSHIGVGQTDSRVAHLAMEPLVPQSARDTDNAWTEADVWAADMSHLTNYVERPDGGLEWRRIAADRKHNKLHVLANTVNLHENVERFVEMGLNAFGFD